MDKKTFSMKEKTIKHTIVYHVEGLSFTACGVLSFLIGNRNNSLKWTQKYIRQRFNISRNGMAATLKTLKNQGYITYTTRRNCPTEFELTKKALEILDENTTSFPYAHTEIEQTPESGEKNKPSGTFKFSIN